MQAVLKFLCHDDSIANHCRSGIILGRLNNKPENIPSKSPDLQFVHLMTARISIRPRCSNLPLLLSELSEMPHLGHVTFLRSLPPQFLCLSNSLLRVES